MRRTPLGPGKKSLGRGSTFAKRASKLKRTRLKPVNRARQERMRLQQFGGKHRDRIVSKRCQICGRAGPSDPAHVIARGMGGVKGRWWHLIPLCREHHQQYDQYKGRLGDEDIRRELELAAYREAWISWEYGYAPHEPPVPRPRRL